MALSIFVFITLLKLALSLPEPDPNVKVRVDVEVDDRGCGCCNNEKCCTFDGVKYRSGYNLVVGCAELCCKRDGEWEYKGIDKDCGNCMVGGEPWVYPFGHPIPPDYKTGANGTYVLSQLGVSKLATTAFRVNGDFHPNYAAGPDKIKGVTCYENGDAISVKCWFLGTTCRILLVSVNGGTALHTVPPFPGVSGLPVGIWVFKLGNCIIIVGKKITVKMCHPPVPSAPKGHNLPWVFIYAPQSLRSLYPGQLYGLCNTYTVNPSTGYYASDGTIYTTVTAADNDPFVESWKYP